jgi:penicillin-insensitive murein endopeptidase
MVDAASRRPVKRFDAGVMRLLALVAGDPRVDRVFVNPILKQALCQRAGADRDWLRKIRPWWGHAEHFHARLSCPAASPACEPQPPLPPGDGCAEIDWWLSPEAEAERRKGRDEYQARVGAAAALPTACSALLDGVPVAPVAAPAPGP